MPQSSDQTRASSRPFGRRRKHKQKEELRRLILNAAGELFVEAGYNAFSMRELARRVGYAPATLYLYFRDKDDLLFSVVDDAFARFRAELAEAAAGAEDPWECLNRIGEAYVRFGLTQPACYQLMFMWRSDYLNQSMQGEHSPRLAAFQVLVDAVGRAQRLGAVKPGDAGAYSDLMWAAMHGVVALALKVPQFTAERTAELAANMKEALYLALRP